MRKAETRLYSSLIETITEMIRSAEWASCEKEKNERRVKHRPIKMEINRFNISRSSGAQKGLFQHLSGSFCVQLNEFEKKNVWCVNFIQLTLALSLIRDGLQLSDISGAAYSQWCKEKQPPNFTVFILPVVCLFFFSHQTNRQEKNRKSALISHVRGAVAGDIRCGSCARKDVWCDFKRDERHVGNVLIILIILTQD